MRENIARAKINVRRRFMAIPVNSVEFEFGSRRTIRLAGRSQENSREDSITGAGQWLNWRKPPVKVLSLRFGLRRRRGRRRLFRYCPRLVFFDDLHIAAEASV